MPAVTTQPDPILVIIEPDRGVRALMARVLGTRFRVVGAPAPVDLPMLMTELELDGPMVVLIDDRRLGRSLEQVATAAPSVGIRVHWMDGHPAGGAAGSGAAGQPLLPAKPFVNVELIAAVGQVLDAARGGHLHQPAA